MTAAGVQSIISRLADTVQNICHRAHDAQRFDDVVVLQHLATELERRRHEALSRGCAWQVDGLQQSTMCMAGRAT